MQPLLLLSFFLVFKPLSLKEATIRVRLPVEFGEITSTVRQFHIRLLLGFAHDIKLDFVFLCVQHVSICEIRRKISQTHEVANAKTLVDPLGLLVSVFI